MLHTSPSCITTFIKIIKSISFFFFEIIVPLHKKSILNRNPSFRLKVKKVCCELLSARIYVHLSYLTSPKCKLMLLATEHTDLVGCLLESVTPLYYVFSGNQLWMTYLNTTYREGRCFTVRLVQRRTTCVLHLLIFH